MNTPYLSIVMPTMRVGGLDIVLAGLRRQTLDDYEFILVDSLFDQRRDVVAARAPRWRHMPPRDNPFPLNAFCRSANTGLAAARGEVVLFVTDYTFLPPESVERHAEFHQGVAADVGLMCPYRYADLPPVTDSFPAYEPNTLRDCERYAEDARSGRLAPFMWSLLAAPFDVDPTTLPADPQWSHPDVKASRARGPNPFRTDFHGKHESCRRSAALAVHGWNEALDGTHGWQDSEFVERLYAHGAVNSWIVDPTNIAYIVNPRPRFPFARRDRDYLENERTWRALAAKGYPLPPPLREAP